MLNNYIPAINGLDDTSEARLMLHQRGRPVHGPLGGIIGAPYINTLLPTLIGDIDLINPIFGAVRTGASGSEAANNLAFANAINEAKEQAALHSQNYGVIKVPSGAFRADDPLAFDVDCDRISLIGMGSKATSIITGDNSIDLLSLDGSTGSTGVQDFAICGVKFAYIGSEVDRTGSADKKAEPALIRLRNVANFRLFDIECEGGYNDLVINRGAHGNISHFQSWKRATLYATHAGIVFTALSDMPGGCTRIFMDNFDLQNRNALAGGCERGILVETADGLQITNAHVIQTVNNLVFSPVGDTNRDVIGGVFLDNFYSDTCTSDGILIQGEASNYGRIVMTSGYLRDAGRDGLRINPTAGTTVKGVTIGEGVEVHSNTILGINCVTDEIEGLRVFADFKGNNTDNDAAGGDIVVRGTDYEIAGKYTDGGAAGTAINLTSDAGVGTVRDYDVSSSTAGTTLLDNSTAADFYYLEGTFTPRIDGSTSAGTGTYSVQVGDYTKIGNRVLFTATVTWSAHTGTGNIVLAGLPFAATATSTAAIEYSGLTYTNPPKATIVSGTSTALIRSAASNAGIAGIAIEAAATIRVSGQYKV